MVSIVEASPDEIAQGQERLFASYPGCHWLGSFAANVKAGRMRVNKIVFEGVDTFVLWWIISPVGTLYVTGAACLIDGENHADALDAAIVTLARLNGCQFAGFNSARKGFAAYCAPLGWKPHSVSYLKEIT